MLPGGIPTPRCVGNVGELTSLNDFILRKSVPTVFAIEGMNFYCTENEKMSSDHQFSHVYLTVIRQAICTRLSFASSANEFSVRQLFVLLLDHA
jgi:hypothetical protein